MFPHAISNIRGTSHAEIYRLHMKYGPVVRASPNDVTHTTGVAWKDIFNHNRDPEFGKSIKIIPVNGSHGFFTAGRHDHRRYRHNFSNAFSQQGLLTQEKRVQQFIDTFIHQLRQKAPEGPQDVVEWLNWLTFDIIGDLAFGASFESLEKTKSHPWVITLLQTVKGGVFLTTLMDYGLAPYFKYILPKKVQDARLSAYQFTSDRIDARVKHLEPRGDFLDVVLARGLTSQTDAEKLPVESKDAHLTLNEVKSTAANFVLAGSETTATLLSGVIFNLLTHPSIHDRIVDEVRSTFASLDEITINAASSRLPYMLNVLDEGLRMYPPVPFLTGRLVPDTGNGGAQVAGRFYPAGTRVHIPAWAANYDPANFTRPNEFLPERWSNPKPKEFEHDNKDGIFQPFSMGPRNCLGRNLAYAEMRVTLAKLLWSFDLSAPANFNETWVETQKTFILWEKAPLYVNVKAREGT